VKVFEIDADESLPTCALKMIGRLAQEAGQQSSAACSESLPA
jgi:hypothetical protein